MIKENCDASDVEVLLDTAVVLLAAVLLATVPFTAKLGTERCLTAQENKLDHMGGSFMRLFFLVVGFWKKRHMGERRLTKVTERIRFRNSREQNKQEYTR